MRVLDKQYHAVPNGQCVDERLSGPHHASVRDASLDEPPNVDGVQRVPNDEPNGGHNDGGVDEDSAQPHS